MGWVHHYHYSPSSFLSPLWTPSVWPLCCQCWLYSYIITFLTSFFLLGIDKVFCVNHNLYFIFQILLLVEKNRGRVCSSWFYWKKVQAAGILSFHQTEHSYWDCLVWGWLLPLLLHNGKSPIVSQDKDWEAKFKYCILIPLWQTPVHIRHILVHAY